jgi:uncharacterized glyoxalase superfamily protein PhnB
MIDFLKSVFGPSHLVGETFRAVGSAGGYHSEVRVGDCMMMIGGGGAEVAWRGETRPMAFHIYVPDIDATYARALAAGATSLEPPADQPWGERTANVKDPCGNNWYIATFQGADYFSEGAPTIQPYLHPLKSAPVIEFMVRAFGGNESGRATSDEGVILHTQVGFGDATVELLDAVGGYRPMPSMFYLYVPDVDATYRRALEAGATSIAEPVDHDYGERCGGVEDAFGNKWYIATPLATAGPA